MSKISHIVFVDIDNYKIVVPKEEILLFFCERREKGIGITNGVDFCSSEGTYAHFGIRNYDDEEYKREVIDFFLKNEIADIIIVYSNGDEEIVHLPYARDRIEEEEANMYSRIFWGENGLYMIVSPYETEREDFYNKYCKKEKINEG